MKYPDYNQRKKYWRMEKEYKQLFFKTFNKNLDDYLNVFTGFDIVKFDIEVIKTPENISMKDYILKYDLRVQEMIETLVKG